ncbi:primosomal replication protein N [Sporomusaceae bacterium BoRhaA]|uniref:hypothetical protein n=1 Tax=Pelorhabdus rhamnosifermentans TaxID=2772457 RepID=UPI001C05F268|nr:hypothetical protein [Pelorhabdus rhamnosifermentans]MBU2701671.1 primosomal replication protein N [Pelorhabdus rhamnosifermentans]
MIKKTKGLLSAEVIKSMQETAEMMVTYRNALIENGTSEQDALKMTIAYQGQQMEAALKATIEREKNQLLFSLDLAENKKLN